MLVHDQICAIRQNPCDLSREAIAALRHCLDEVLPVFGIAQRFSQLRDVHGQVGFFDKAVRPKPLHQLFLLDDMPAALDEGEQRLEHLRLERHGLAVAQQAALLHVQSEVAELVQLLRLLAHNRD